MPRRVAERFAADDLSAVEASMRIAESRFLKVGELVERRGMGPMARVFRWLKPRIISRYALARLVAREGRDLP